jgi:hypothetical protein
LQSNLKIASISQMGGWYQITFCGVQKHRHRSDHQSVGFIPGSELNKPL